MYKITVNLPNLGPGVLVEIDGVGIFENGSTTVLPDDFSEQAFIAHHAPSRIMQDDATVSATYGKDKAAEYNLLTAFKSANGITVEEVKKAATVPSKKEES